jgi:two-component system sensor histidine kinase VanS
VVGLLGGWLLAGWMLRPLTRITDATRRAATGSLSHRIRLEGRNDELRVEVDRLQGLVDDQADDQGQADPRGTL